MSTYQTVYDKNFIVFSLTTEEFCQVIREDNDITLVGWGVQLTVMEQACLDVEKVLALYYFKSKIIGLPAVSNMGLELIMAGRNIM